MGGVPGTRPARVVVIGAGVSGQNAAAMAIGMQADVVVMETTFGLPRYTFPPTEKAASPEAV